MKEIAQSLRDTISFILPQLRQISDAEAALKPRPEKWSKKEVLGHLIDSACNNQQKFVRTMQQTHLDFVGYQQNAWVALQRYNEADWTTLIDIWVAYNQQIAHIIEHADPSVLEHTITIEGTGPFSLSFIMADYGEHLKHHLLQILPHADLKSGFSNVYNA
ncbi:MAG: DinB family protein [Saprospiraceae bacterium]|nr:DinB family protein [Saprospiraceae bacterium]